MSYSAAATSLLELVQAALADNETPVRITLSSDGASMVVATENGHEMTVTAGDGDLLTMAHDDWIFTINERARPLDAAAIVGYVAYVANLKVLCAA